MRTLDITEMIAVLFYVVSFVLCVKAMYKNRKIMNDLKLEMQSISFLHLRSKRLVDQLENQSKLLDELTSEMLKKVRDAELDAQEHSYNK
ncbi:hypothetical protein [Enterococcus sp. DIV0240a]|uniref:hypothetical protein n=1 Tax=Enterococcus sp. DIV0240a TaxID=2774651 RepID=UPI003D290C77